MRKRGALRESGRRSKLEDRIAAVLEEAGVTDGYETQKLSYTVPESNHKYLVDFTLPNGICLEAKGFLRDYDERHKYELIKEQHPEVDLRFIFDNPEKMISRTKMTHGDWATKSGFPWCGVKDTEVIKEWVAEKAKTRRKD